MKKSLVASMAAVLIFGLMGLGFAMWSDTVQVSAAVSTGNVNIGIRDMGTNDNILTTAILGGTATNSADGFADAMTLGGDPQINPGVNSEGKNVANFISVNNNCPPEFLIGDAGYFASITETITNAYPYYAPSTKIQIASNGSIPVKLDGLKVVPSGNLTGFNYGAWTITKPDGNTATGSGFDALVAALNGIQLHQNQVVTIELQVWFAQNTEENSSGALTFTVHAAQWNEAGQDDPSSEDF